MLSNVSKGIKRRHRRREQELYLILNHINISQNTRILEIGCGDGYQSTILKTKSNNVISTDIGHERGYAELNVICDGQCLPFRDRGFDVIYSSNVLEHIHNKDGALREMKRVLSSNGVIIIVVPISTWKILQCSMHYALLVHNILKSDLPTPN